MFWWLKNLAPVCILFAAAPAEALSPAEKAKCDSVQTDELIDAPILRLVRAGQSFSATAMPGEINPLPYNSVIEFKSKNPDCCEVLPEIPGDFPVRIQRLGSPYQSPPRIFAVGLRYFEASKNGLINRHKIYLVSCLGKIETEEQLLNKMEE